MQTHVTTAVPVPTPNNGFWSDTAKVGGTFAAIGVVVFALAALVIWLLWRRRRAHDSIAIRSVSDAGDGHATTAAYGSEKRTSRLTLATAGLAGLRRGDSGEKSAGTHETPASMSRRASIPLVHDQRLNPQALFHLDNTNGSHVSLGSFQDNRDYSRPVLHIANPD